MTQVKDFREKFSKIVSFKSAAICSVVLFALSLAPILYIGLFVNRATGDDFGFGWRTRRAFLEGGFFDFVGAIADQVRHSYETWQGTWFTIALFTLQPEVFSEKAYFIVTPLTLILWMSSLGFLLYIVMIKKMRYSPSSVVLTAVLVLAASIQLAPSFRSAFFFYNGIVHYQIPFFLCLVLAGLLFRYIEEYKWRYLVLICLIAAALGGGSYAFSLLGLILLGAFLLVSYVLRRKAKGSFLLLPIALLLIGLAISMMAPGNKVRGGEDFGFSIGRAALAIGDSFIAGTRDIMLLFREKPWMIIILTVLLIVIFIATYTRKNIKTESEGFRYPLPGVFAVFSFLTYIAMYCPEHYARVEVSNGVYNSCFFVFVLLVLANGLYFFNWLHCNKSFRPAVATWRICAAAIALCGVLAVVPGIQGNMRLTAFWQSIEYIASGQAAYYVEQNELRTRLLLDEETRGQDVVIPYIHVEQGPMMYMPMVFTDKEAWTNVVTSLFYGKRTITVIVDMDEWNELYGS